MLALLLTACAAPVPAEGIPTRETLAGRWSYRYGTTDGWLYFDPDGTYAAECGGVYCGEWWVTDLGEVRLREVRVAPGSEAHYSAPSDYLFGRPDTRVRGVIRFECWPGAMRGSGRGTAVVLTRQPGG